MPAHRDWTRDELLLAMNLYCRLPFGQFHRNNPDVITLAQAIGRTPSSVAMKLCNLASLDPAERARGVVGLSGASRADRAIWEEFHRDWERAAVESQELYDARVPAPAVTPSEPATDSPQSVPELETAPAVTEAVRETRIRVGQDFFRRAVLASYAGRCCVTGIPLPELLVASHILPWSRFPQHRVDPRNGLCLSRLHDAAFDRGLITFDADLRLLLSPRLRDQLTNATLHASFVPFEGRPLTLPERFQPNIEFLSTHQQNVFVG